MTLLFYWPEKDMVGCDSQITHNDGTGTSLNGKIHSGVGGTGCSCGTVFGSEAAIDRALELVSEGKTFGRCHINFDQAGFVRDKQNRVWLFICNGGEIVVSKPPSGTPTSLGSGAAWFDAFCSRGLSPLDAAKEVATLHDECGGDICTF